jgi:PIN domain nuclease of toxin-antitoxin system
LFDEQGTELVAEILNMGDAVVSSVNYAETVSKLVDRQMPEEMIRITMENLGLEVVAFDESQAQLTGILRKSCSSFGLSLGDRACFALAKVTNYPVMTADRVWGKVMLGVEVKLIR